MPVSQQNLYFSRADTFSFPCLAQDYQQNIINLTGVIAISCIARRSPSSATIFGKGVGTGIAINSLTLGTFTVTVAPEDTVTLPNAPQVLIYDIVVNNAAGNMTTVQGGLIYLSPQTIHPSNTLSLS